MATTLTSITPVCSICFESIKIPTVLPCGHTFCLSCIERYICDKKETFPCPICQQDIKILEGGAKVFTTNLIVQTNLPRIQPTSTTQPKCPNHKQKEVDYYCNNCNVGLCMKCILGQHKEHETQDIDCDETRNKAIRKFQRSQTIIQSRIQNLEKTRSILLDSFELVKSLCEDSCAKVNEKTEQIVSDSRKSCEQIIKEISKNLEENRSKVEDREKEITEINLLGSNMDSIIQLSTLTTLNILHKLPRLIEKEKLCESRRDYNLCIQYLQWVGKDFSLDIHQLGSVISKSFYILSSYQFLFDVSDVKEDCTDYYNSDKFTNNNLEWSGYVSRSDDDLYIGIELSPDDNPKLNYCIIDGQLSLLNIHDDSKTVTRTGSNMRFKREDCWDLSNSITWSELTNKNNGYINSNGQFVIQCDITQIREISFK